MFVGYSPNVDFMGSSSAVAGSERAEAISFADFNRYFERLQESRNVTKLTAPERQRMQNEVVESLVNRSLVVQPLKITDLRSCRGDALIFLCRSLSFRRAGSFSLLRYKELIRMQGMSEARFEKSGGRHSCAKNE